MALSHGEGAGPCFKDLHTWEWSKGALEGSDLSPVCCSSHSVISHPKCQGLPLWALVHPGLDVTVEV